MFLVGYRFLGMHDPFVYDEVYSWVTAQAQYPFTTVFNDVLRQDVNLPLFNVLLRLWAYWVPAGSVAWMRLFSILCSLGTLAAVWGLAPVSWSRVRKGVYSIFLASSCVLVQYAGVVRTYALSVLLVTVCTLVALRIVEAMQQARPVPRWQWMCFFGGGLLCAYTHYYAACLFFSTALYVFIRACGHKCYRKTVFISTGGVFAGWMVWVIHTVRTMLLAPQATWWFGADGFRSSWDILALNLGAPPLTGFIGVFFLIGVLGLLLTPRPPLTHPDELWLPVFQGGCLLAALAVVSLKHNLWYSRYFIISLPSFYLLLTGLLLHLVRRWAGWWVLLPLFVCGQLWQFAGLAPAQPDPSGLQRVFNFVNRLGYREALVMVERITYPGPSAQWVLQYYMPPDRPIRIIPLTDQNVGRMYAPDELPLVIPMGGFTFVMKASLQYHYPVDSAYTMVGHTFIMQYPNFHLAPRAALPQRSNIQER